MKPINSNQIFEQWSPMIQEQTEISDRYKLNWLSTYCHYHTLSESKNNLFESAYSALGTFPSMGNIALPGNPGGPSAFYNTGNQGSGDKFPSLLPLAIQVAARTIGLETVSVIPMPGPTFVLSYLDYVYANGNLSSTTRALIIKLAITGSYTVGTNYWIQSASSKVSGSTKGMVVTYVGKSRIDGNRIFKIGQTYLYSGSTWASTEYAISDIVDGTSFTYSLASATNPNSSPSAGSTSSIESVTVTASLVSALEDHIQGYSGAGLSDGDNYSSQYSDGQSDKPMGRGTGESTYYRTLGLTTFTKTVQAETFQVAANVTTEQIQDLGKQYGIDVTSMVENALVNETSQAINKHILSRAFALGWSNNQGFLAAEGVTLNVNLDLNSPGAGTSPAFELKDATTTTLTVPAVATYGNQSENLYTWQRRLFSKILAAMNVVNQRGRRGPATFIVTNLQLATAIQDNSQFTAVPFANSVSQNTGALYPIGTVAGMTVYVDPNMRWDDTRVLVGRKGADDEPGIKFMPYMMAEAIHTISEGTMAPKIAVKSRYALVEAGFHPETQYYTIYVNLGTTFVV